MRKTAHKYWIYAAIFAVVIALSSLEARAQQFGVKTNALMWGLCAPNAGVEIVVGERCSLDISGFAKPSFGSATGPFLNSYITGFQPEFRYWFSGRPMTREFIGVSALFADYDLANQDSLTGKMYIYSGNAVSLGVVGGYSFILGKDETKLSRWRLEICGGFSLLAFLQKRYAEGDSYDDYFVGEPVKANTWGYKLFPAKLGVTFTYIIK